MDCSRSQFRCPDFGYKTESRWTDIDVPISLICTVQYLHVDSQLCLAAVIGALQAPSSAWTNLFAPLRIITLWKTEKQSVAESVPCASALLLAVRTRVSMGTQRIGYDGFHTLVAVPRELHFYEQQRTCTARCMC